MVVVAAIIGLNILAYLLLVVACGDLSFSAGQLVWAGGLYGPAIDSGEVWRLLTATYLHAGPIHLLSNMLALWFWGVATAERLGALRFITVYTLGGLAGSVYAVSAHPMIVGIGASGAIAGILAALFVLRLRGDDSLSWRYLLQAFGYNALLSFASPEIDWQAHAGGFIGGGLVALLLTARGR
jgi:membrane associated rhomboid family serine protease